MKETSLEEIRLTELPLGSKAKITKHDESEFHSQLIKLMGLTKIPIILTMSA
jgi:hypothetical protein